MNDCKTRSGRAFDRQAWTYDTARFGSHARGLYPVLLEQLVQIPVSYTHLDVYKRQV